jgi:hypothetical protein
MTDKEKNGWIKFVPSLELPKERVSIAYKTHDERGYRFAYGHFQFYNGTCGCFWKDGNEQPKVVKVEDIMYWMPIPSFDSMQEEPVTSDFETALAKEWKGYNDRGAATVDALEDNTQELAFAKGFYRGWNYPKEKPVSEDLEKDIEKEWNCYSKDGDIAVINVLSFKLIAQHFIQWQKQQMMKEAFVYEKKHDTAMILASECLRNHGWFNREHDFNDLWQFICGVKELFVGEFKDGDKVKILVIKED